jgi:glutamate-5-semialdehyde dehydrogenase
MSIQSLSLAAKAASIELAAAKTDLKNNALAQIAASLLVRKSEIITANQNDLTKAENENIALPLLKRLKFDEAKIAVVCAGIESLIALDDPVGKTISAMELGNWH